MSFLKNVIMHMWLPIMVLLVILVASSDRPDVPNIDETKISNWLDFPKQISGKLYFCQQEGVEPYTYKIDLFNKEIIEITFYPTKPSRNSMEFFDMLDMDEGRNEVRFKIEDRIFQFIKETDNGRSSVNFQNWTLNKTEFRAKRIVYAFGDSHVTRFECNNTLPSSLKRFGLFY